MIKAKNERDFKSSPSSVLQDDIQCRSSFNCKMEKNSSDETKAETKARYSYTKEEMISISKLACSRTRPKCLDNAFNSANGLWNPDKWITNKSGDNHSVSRVCENLSSGAFKRDRLMDGHDLGKRKSCDQKERVRDELEDDIVLSPQRRSFGTGCHATAFKNESRSQRDTVHDSRETEHVSHRSRNSAQSRVGSGRIVACRDRGNDWSERSAFDKDRNYERSSFKDEDTGRKGKYNRYDFENRKCVNSSRNRNYRDSRNYEEDEPEWFTGGPTSQHETIELKGFDECENEDKITETSSEMKGRRDSRCQSRSSSRSEILCEDKRPCSRTNYNAPAGKLDEKEARRNENAKDFTHEFDINEIFKMDNWRSNSLGTVESVTTTVNPEVTLEANQTGTSRFAQWFSDKARENSVERLFATSSTQEQSSAENVKHVLGKQVTLRSSSGDLLADDGCQQNGVNSDEKDIVNILQRANINVSCVVQNTVPSVPFDTNSVRCVSDLEAAFKNSLYVERNGEPMASTTLPVNSSIQEYPQETAYEPQSVIDLLKEDDLFAINQQLLSFENTRNGSGAANTSFPVRFTSQREFPIPVTHQNYDPRVNLLFQNTENSSFLQDINKLDKRGVGEQLHYSNSSNENAFVKNTSTSNIAAFTPTSVIRKFASEKEKESLHRIVKSEENSKLATPSQNPFSVNGVSTNQCISNTTPRPIVKGTNTFFQHQPLNTTNPSDLDSLSKFVEHQRLQQQQQQTITSAALAAQRQVNMSPISQSAAVRVGAPRNANSSVRPNLANASISANFNANMPLIRNMVNAATVNQSTMNNTMNPIQYPLQPRGTAFDTRQLQAFAQSSGLHPVAIQQLLIKAAANIQTHAAAAAAAAAAAVTAAQAQFGRNGSRPINQPLSPTRPIVRTDVGHTNESLHDIQNHTNMRLHHNQLPSHEFQSTATAHCPENLTKWFGNDVLNEKLTEMPPVPVQKAVLLEDIERQ